MTTQTKAAVLFNLNKPLKIITLNLPEPKKGEVLVKIFYSGICHTQLLEIAGKNAAGSFIPNLMGHEASGEVIRTGMGVSKVKKGDRVVLSWIKGKGQNVIPEPINYKNNKINRGSVTTFSNYSVVSENRVFKISNKLPLHVASLLGCAVPTGMGMIFNNAKLKKNSSIIIIGCGGIGINAINASKYLSAKYIIGVDVKNKSELTKRFGATHFLNYNIKNIEEKIKKIVGQNGSDYVVDTVGKKETMELAYELANNHKGHVILCGVPNPLNLKISINPFPLYYGKKLVGTGGGETNPDKDLKKYSKMFFKNQINLEKMVTKIFSLRDINKAINFLKKGNCVRVLIDMNR